MALGGMSCVSANEICNDTTGDFEISAIDYSNNRDLINNPIQIEDENSENENKSLRENRILNDTTQNIDENNLTEINNTNNSTENNKNIDIRDIIFNENVSLNASSGIIVPINSAEASGAAGTAINDAGQKYVKLLDDLGFFEYLDEHPDACAIYFADMCSGYIWGGPRFWAYMGMERAAHSMGLDKVCTNPELYKYMLNELTKRSTNMDLNQIQQAGENILITM